MALPDPCNTDNLVWRIPAVAGESRQVEGPGFDPPLPWVNALDSVGRDLRCHQHGRHLDTDRLVWNFSINRDYNAFVGWRRIRGIGGFDTGGGLTMDASFGEAATWVAEVVQDNLAGYEFIQWPSRGRHLLVPRLRSEEAVWVDPRSDVTICPIGELCKHSDRWARTLPQTR